MGIPKSKVDQIKKSILIVEDDNFFREALRAMLEKSGYTVLEAPNGKIAKDVIKTSILDLVLSDVQMPFCDGLELLEWLNNNKPIPFILMTGFSHILETKTAFDKGAKGFISKPFSPSEIVAEIKSVIDTDQHTEGSDKSPKSSDFCKVSIEEFVASKHLNFDIYVQLSKDKIVKIGNKGTDIPIERIENYKTKGLRHLYIRREDFSNLVRFNLDLSKVVNKSSKIPKEKKVNFMKYTGEVLLEKAFVEGLDEQSFNDAKDFISSSIEVIAEDDTSFDLLNHLNTHSDYLYAHSLCVSMYSIMIARKMGISMSQTFFKLSMAGLFHDIGKKEIGIEILDRPRPLLSVKERQLIESHATRGKEILSCLPSIPQDVIQITYEHHEDCLGQGYPRGINKNAIHPLAKILSVANIFAEHAIKNASHEGMSGIRAIGQMNLHHEEKLDSEAFSALKKLFQMK